MAKYTEYEIDNLGKMIAVSDGGRLTFFTWANLVDTKDMVREETALHRDVYRQIKEYLKGERTKFRLPATPEVSIFERSCLEAAQAIPFGETRSYAEIAASVGSPDAARAVGAAMAKNPICVIFPCHRVIGANGDLTGYAGGIETKKYLLELEKYYAERKITGYFRDY